MWFQLVGTVSMSGNPKGKGLTTIVWIYNLLLTNGLRVVNHNIIE
jgi:hypothetical protein